MILLLLMHLKGTCGLQRTFREIMFLQELNSHDNIIKSAFAPSSAPPFPPPYLPTYYLYFLAVLL